MDEKQLINIANLAIDEIKYLKAEVERLQAENETLETTIFNLQQQLLIEGHSENCACVQAASVDCSCGARKP